MADLVLLPRPTRAAIIPSDGLEERRVQRRSRSRCGGPSGVRRLDLIGHPLQLGSAGPTTGRTLSPPVELLGLPGEIALTPIQLPLPKIEEPSTFLDLLPILGQRRHLEIDQRSLPRPIEIPTSSQ
jgi:hypothetical protein